jgi:hypothetical protein
MSLEIYLILMIITLASIYYVAPILVCVFRRYRGKQIVTCPETRKACEVEVDARHAAFTALLSYPELRMKACSRWPERHGCAQECMLQIQILPENQSY